MTPVVEGGVDQVGRRRAAGQEHVDVDDGVHRQRFWQQPGHDL